MPRSSRTCENLGTRLSSDAEIRNGNHTSTTGIYSSLCSYPSFHSARAGERGNIYSWPTQLQLKFLQPQAQRPKIWAEVVRYGASSSHTVFSSPAVRAPFVGLVVPFATIGARWVTFLFFFYYVQKGQIERAEKHSGPAKKNKNKCCKYWVALKYMHL